MAASSSNALEAFFATRSRVVRLFNLPAMAETFLAKPFPSNVTMWEDGGSSSVWAVFETHEEACLALSLRGNVATALESDLEPFHNLKRLPSSSSSMLDFTISTNPPNPKTSFRSGDWICPQPKCAAHNFGRNHSCIGCGCTRSGNPSTTTTAPNQQITSLGPLSRLASSPRFTVNANANDQAAVMYPQGSASTVFYSSAQPDHQQHLNAPSLYEEFPRPRQQPQPQMPQRTAPQQQLPPRATNPHLHTGMSSNMSNPMSNSMSTGAAAHPPQPPKPSHPILTPSGRAFAVGGRVQNISSDPLSPCIMYWPDNEPFPEQGQIRPSNVVGVTPPILNTGNRGPISHQPGDWICQKCNYLNWRRRKVCQTCLPYAEGNGDSISAAVQAERIALLTQVLSQTQLSGPSSAEGTAVPNGGVMSQPQAPTVSTTTPNHIHQALPPSIAVGGSSNISVGSSPFAMGVANRTSTLTPPQVRRNVMNSGGAAVNLSQKHHDLLGPGSSFPGNQGRTLHHSLSHSSLGSGRLSASPQQQQPLYSSASPIYQTSAAQRSPLPQSLHLGSSPLPRTIHLPLQQQRSFQNLHAQQHPIMQQREPSPLYTTGPHRLSQTSTAGFNKTIGSNPAGNISRGSLNSNGSGGVPSLTSASTGSSSSSGSHTDSARSSPNSLVGVSTVTTVTPSTSPFTAMRAMSEVQSQKNVVVDVHAPAPLLPSFLQDIVHSPLPSPTSTTSSAEFSLDGQQQRPREFGAIGSGRTKLTRSRVSSNGAESDSGSSSAGSSVRSIWRLDGEETKSLTGFVGGHQGHVQEIYATSG
ncbi:hypothetical protein BKA70DRAFT_537208 [Coprinopsis sp. MPI-PUGE-AT-0042]|nr:hypothetical protein BKA70DRAFT_537208 [Coprinopsis sp. MPI-PUGE-AT-0042]